MADVIGVLGESSVITAGTNIVYTVAAGKAAKGKIMFQGQAGSGGTMDFSIQVNGATVMSAANIAASNYIFSSPNALYEVTAALPTGVDGDTTCAPAPSTYYLSAGDIVSYIIADESAITMKVMFVGTEIDVT